MHNNNHILNDPDAEYKKAEDALLKEALNRSYKERFLMATRLYKIQKAMEKASISHKSFISR